MAGWMPASGPSVNRSDGFDRSMPPHRSRALKIKYVTRRANRWLAAILRPLVSGSVTSRFVTRIASKSPSLAFKKEAPPKAGRFERVFFSIFERQASVRRTSAHGAQPDQLWRNEKASDLV